MERMMSNWRASAAIAALAAVLPVQATELYVDCQAGGMGSIRGDSYVFVRIGDALAVAQPGDSILVAEGLYRENITIPRGVSLGGGYSRLAVKPTIGKKGIGSRILEVPVPHPRVNLTVIEAWDPTKAVVTLSPESQCEGFVVRGGAVGIESRTETYAGFLPSTVRDCLIESNGVGVRYALDVPSNSHGHPVATLIPRLERSLVVGNDRGMVIDIDPHEPGTDQGCAPAYIPSDLDLALDKVSMSYNKDFGVYFVEDGRMFACENRILVDLGRTLVRNNGREGMFIWTGFNGRRTGSDDTPLVFRFHDSWLEKSLGEKGLWRGVNWETIDLLEFRRSAIRENRGDGLWFINNAGWRPRYVLDHSLVEGNRWYGLWNLGWWTTITLTDNLIRNNGQFGGIVDDSPSIISFSRNRVRNNGVGGFLGFVWYIGQFNRGPERYNEFSGNGYFDFGCLGCEVAEGDDLLPADLRDTYWGPKPQTLEEIDARVLDDEEAEGVRPTPLVPWSTLPAKRVTASLLSGPARITENGRLPVRLTIDMSEARTRLSRVDADVVWDPTVLRLAAQTVQGADPGSHPLARVGAPLGNLKDGRLLIKTDLPSSPGGIVTLGCLEFEPVSPAGWHSALELDFHELKGSDGGDLLPYLWHLPEYVRVREDTVFGDVTSDKKITREDAQAILDEEVHELRGWRQREAIDDGLAELDGDGTTDSTDANIILSTLAGLKVPPKTGSPARKEVPFSCFQNSDPNLALAADLFGEKIAYAQLFSVERPERKVPFLYALLIRKEGLQRLGSMGGEIHFDSFYFLNRWWVPEGVTIQAMAGHNDAERGGFRFSMADPVGLDGDFVPIVLELWTWIDYVDPRNVFWVEFESLATISPNFADLKAAVEEQPELVSQTSIELPFEPVRLSVPATPDEQTKNPKLDAFPPNIRKIMEEHKRGR